jgi:hypothetical protein
MELQNKLKQEIINDTTIKKKPTSYENGEKDSILDDEYTQSQDNSSSNDSSSELHGKNVNKTKINMNTNMVNIHPLDNMQDYDKHRDNTTLQTENNANSKCRDEKKEIKEKPNWTDEDNWDYEKYSQTNEKYLDINRIKTMLMMNISLVY